MGAGGKVFDDSDEFFLCSDEWLYVCFFAVFCSPNSDGAYKVGVCMCIVELFHGVSGDKFVGVFEFMDYWLEFFYDVYYCLCVFEVVLYV